MDVTGTWELTINYTTCTSQNLDSRGCGYLLSLGGGEMMTLTQTGNEVTGTSGYMPVVLTGRLDGQSLSLDGSGRNDKGDLKTQHWRLQVSADRITGTVSKTAIYATGLPDFGSPGTTVSSGQVTRGVRQK